ncbi:hypothetical protein Oweho_3201 [Owenweeksia hongkongensis DSM 17368]|uniref:Uncharacterized protein n=1 Tax=Owenweeksia hongkongensis (strain DSM 17368 / CIP 108786 / JCM 12287 / NRRL B-23963 / UST20020801) TaxID=926562 RepID=G8R3R5_OWEHD|nr:hypothetical protein [Owenweeksia hongkongensis]AEV34152.1 hypothetical protein Oweho_3201 [Owenweeksia hongkongensis DSM 17368]
MRYEEQGAYSAVATEQSVFIFEDKATNRAELQSNLSHNNMGLEWDDLPISVDKYTVFPFGENNALHRSIRKMLKQNPIGTRVLKKRLFLAWGMGPFLYKHKFTDGEISQEFIQNPEIEAWLRSFNYRSYLRKAIDDYNKGEYITSKTFNDRGSRIGRPSKVARIEHVPAAEARLAQLKSKETEDPDLIIVGDWDHRHQKAWKVYPRVHDERFTEHGVGIHFASNYTYAVKHYPLPDILSVEPSMGMSTVIPILLKNFVANNLTVPWHIKIPQEYWDAKEKEMRTRAAEAGKTFKYEDFLEAKRNKKREIGKVLSGAENAGKYVTTETITQVLADRHVNTVGWEFDSIDQKVKDFVDSMLSIQKIFDNSTSAGLGMHPSLSNISNGTANSGSEQLYAYLNYINSEVQIPEEVICDTINRAIEVNWPGSGIRLGFYRQTTKKQEDVTPKDRVNDGSTVQ